jgi:hypothetical protein
MEKFTKIRNVLNFILLLIGALLITLKYYEVINISWKSALTIIGLDVILQTVYCAYKQMTEV